MTSPPMTVDQYITRFETALKATPMAQAERGRLALEIRSHLTEVETRGPALLERSMSAMGSPESFAKGFLADFELAEAVRFGSVRRILISLVKVSARSLVAFITALGAFTAYVTALAFVLVAALKPVFPHQTGFWLHPLKFGMEFGSAQPRSPELLGLWIIPVALGLAVLWFVAGTVIVRVGGPIVVGRKKARG